MLRRNGIFLLAMLTGLWLGSHRPRPSADRHSASPTATPGPTAVPAAPKPIRFVDVAAPAGIRFRHTTGAFGKKWFPETNGSGAVFFDFDGDGRPDLFLVNGRPWTDAERRAAHLPPAPVGPPTTGRLYHNRGDGTFTDVTAGSGLDIPIYGMGGAAADYDNDGRVDLYVTGIGRNYLFRNEGGGHFREVAGPAGVRDRGWSASAAWVDYDRDGSLDLFVCHYVRWSPATETPCAAGGVDIYCGPNIYEPEACHLFHNRGDGSFEDVSARAGIQRRNGSALRSKALGVAVLDFDGDGWPDLAVANDTEANFLFHNNRNGTFTEMATQLGVAYSRQGEARSGMGIDAGDWDGSGQEGLLIGNFPDEMLGLYRHEPGGLFADVATTVGVGPPSLSNTTFGCLLVDLDNDGWLDIATANGHIDEDHEKNMTPVAYAQHPLFLRNEGGKSFRPFAPFPRTVVGRGLAAADIDGDGDVDLLLTTNGGPPLLLRNEGGEQQHSLRVTLVGVKSNRSAIGAVVKAWVGPHVLRRRIRSGSSYLSQSELPLTLGLGRAERVDRLEVLWPSGGTDTLTNLPAGHPITIREGQSRATTARRL